MTDTNLPDEFWDNAKVRTPDKPVTFMVKMTAEQFRRYAATDDLLEALEEVLDALNFLSGGDHELEGLGIDEKRGAEIRAAIAKAKGQTE